MFVNKFIPITVMRFICAGVLIVAASLLFTGCAMMSQANLSQPKLSQSVLQPSEASQQGSTQNVLYGESNSGSGKNAANEVTKAWWDISFHRSYSENDQPLWHLDALIALQIFKPVLDGNPEITLWRFHRRAGEDAAGQAFSLIFFTSQETAQHIYKVVGNLPLTRDLIAQHYIDQVSYYDTNDKLRSQIEDTSDMHWPVELQKSWPFFIMGVSQTWLSLVEQYYMELKPVDPVTTLAQQDKIFKQVNDKIDKLWESNGSHAFLHHLNALFGYQELYIWERKHVRF